MTIYHSISFQGSRLKFVVISKKGTNAFTGIAVSLLTAAG